MQRVENYFRKPALAVVFFIAVNVTGQTIDEARNLYNEGVKARSDENIELAVQNFHEFIRVSDKLTEDDTYDIINEISTVKGALPQMYLQLTQLKLRDKDMQNGLKYALETKKVAVQFDNDDILSKASDLLGKIYYSQGLTLYRSEKLDDALIELDKAIEEDNNLRAYNLKLVILKDKGEESQLVKIAKEALAAAEAAGDKENAQRFIQLVSTHFYNESVIAKQSTKYDEALEKVLISLEFNEKNPDAYYILTSVYNSKSNWDKAIESATEGLKYETEGNQAKFYYELGNAYFGKGNKTAACEAYNKAAVGEYAETAKYQMEHVVKCN